MNANPDASAATSTWNSPLGVAILGIVAAVLIVVVLTERHTNLPLISEYRGAFVVLLLIGIAMCSFGPLGSVFTTPDGWRQPMNLIAIVLGVLALALVVPVFTGVQVPLIADERAAFIALAVIGAAKLALTIIHRVVLRA